MSYNLVPLRTFNRGFVSHVNYLRASSMSFRSVTVFLALSLNHAAAQVAPPTSLRSYVIHAAHMIDGRSDVVQNDVAVIVEAERILAVGPRAQITTRSSSRRAFRTAQYARRRLFAPR
ncbi:MAG: hypothetical protein DMD30_08010 [Gemmatimonadetes bacterium]|nr:MAG: hypothetical protein DMD30_08010 [Gemmatimonadota bacterium]